MTRPAKARLGLRFFALGHRPFCQPAPVKKPTAEERRHRCTRKRRYRTQGDALDAALIAGVGRERTAYRCPLCGFWHLTKA